MKSNSDNALLNTESTQKLSKFLKYLWPLDRSDLEKFIPLVLMMFLTLMSQNVIRVIKDSLVSIHIGPEAISFIKLYLEMPSGVIFCIIYAHMCNKMSTERAFRIIYIFFISVLLLMAFVIMPNSESLHMTQETINKHVQVYPHLRWFIEISGKWSFAMFYVVGELYPMVAFTLLFWHLANKITTISESRRLYPFLGVFGHTNMLVCKYVIMFFSAQNFLWSFFDGETSEMTIKSLVSFAAMCGVIILGIHYYVERKIVLNPAFVLREANQPLNLSVKESLRVILKSRYLWLILILMLSYSMSINLMEGLWMSKTRELYPESVDFMRYQAQVMFYTGCSTIFVSLIANYTIRKLGWKVAALCTPIAILIGGALFYNAVFFEKHLHLIGIGSSLYVIVMIGGLQNVIGKGVKYSLFDDTKEMSYIPLDRELKTKGKAAVDIMGGKIGKSSGAIIQFLAFSFFPSASYMDISVYLFVGFVLVCGAWIYAVGELSKEYDSARTD